MPPGSFRRGAILHTHGLRHAGSVARVGLVEVDQLALHDFRGQRGLTFRFSSGDTPLAGTGC